jgi:DNA polymerase III gamma/tau subunit
MEHVESTLGLPPADLVLSLIDAVLDGNPATALRSAETLVQQGIALDQVIESLIEGFRGLMLQVTCGQDTDLLDWPQAQRQAMGERASRSRADVFAHAIAVFEAVARQSTLSASSRALFDAAIVRLALSSALEEDSPLAKKKIATRPQAAAPRAAAKPAPRAAAKGRVPTGTTSGASSKSFGKSSRKSSPGASSKAAPKAKSKAAAAVSPTATKTSRDRAPRAAPTPVISSSDLTARWADAVEAMGSRPLQAAAALLEPISLERDILRVRAMAGDSGVLNARIDAMRVAIQKTFGEGVQLVLDRPGQQTQATPTGSPDDVAGDSAISMVSEVFDAQVVQVRNLKEGNNVQGT